MREDSETGTYEITGINAQLVQSGNLKAGQPQINIAGIDPGVGLKSGQGLVVPGIWAKWLFDWMNSSEAALSDPEVQLISQVVLFLATDGGGALLEGAFVAEAGEAAILEARIVGQDMRAVLVDETVETPLVLEMEADANGVFTWNKLKWEQGYQADAQLVGRMPNPKFKSQSGQIVERELLVVRTSVGICVRDATAVAMGGKTLSATISWMPNRIITGNLINPKVLIGVYERELPNGIWIRDTKNALQDIGFPLADNSNFASISKDGFRMLNTPASYYITAEQYWINYNKPWLDYAVSQKAEFVILSNKNDDLLKYKWVIENGLVKYVLDANFERIKTGFCREIEYLDNLVQQGKYQWDATNGVYKYIGP